MSLKKNILNENKVNLQTITVIDEIDQLPELSLTDEKKAKDILSNMRKHLSLTLDKRKMQQANILMDNIETNINIMNDPEIQQNVKDNIKSVLDLKLLSEINLNNFKMLQNLMRLDSVDGTGTAAEIAVAVDWGGGQFRLGIKSD